MNYYILYNGGKIYYADTGSGETIVLLHGYLETSDVWKSFARKLSASFRVISVDIPGHGLSKVYGECHTMEFIAGAVRAILDNLNIRKVFLTGHSMGGYVTLAFLELYPEMLNGYCLFHSHPFADTPAVIEKRELEIKVVRQGRKYLIYPENISNMFAQGNLDQFKESIQRIKDIASTIRDEGIIAVLNGMMQRPSRQKFMEDGRIPCLWILGAKDKYIYCDDIQKRIRLPSSAKVIILDNSGHMGFIEEEDLSVRSVTDFILGLSPETA